MNNTKLTTTQNPLEEIEGNKQSLIFQTQDGLTRIQVELEEETVWLTQEQMRTTRIKGMSEIPTYHSTRCNRWLVANSGCKIL